MKKYYVLDNISGISSKKLLFFKRSNIKKEPEYPAPSTKV